MLNIDKWIITGDTHGQFSHFKNIKGDEHTAVIILGDVGLNFSLNRNDYWRKKSLVKKYPFTFYCVKGNHEERPSNVPNMKLIYDENVKGLVWAEDDFPTIKYFQEHGEYEINGLKTLVVGGAYSIDKQMRLMYDWPWFPSEQLTQEELSICYHSCRGKNYDLVLTHTCPYSWMPTDLFLNNVSDVDNTMEVWFEKFKYEINWNIWLFGHYHEDRLIRPHVEMFFTEMEDLNAIIDRWKKFDEMKELDWRLSKDPNFYMKDIWPKGLEG